MKLLRLLLVPIALLLVGIIRLISPWFLIRFGEIWSHRVGHLAGNTECYLCERDAGMHKGLDIWTFRNHHSNKFLAKMFSRCLLVDHTKFSSLVMLVNRMFRGFEKHIAESAQFDRDIYNLYEKQPPHLKFTAREERTGKRELRKLGIPEGAKWVCLIVRDGAYLPMLGYHKHRDTDVGDYVGMAIELARRGYYVIRMGAKVNSEFNVRHTKIIDYATGGKRTAFMDVYLGAKCEFCVSTATGFDAIPTIFRRPICYVNTVPLEYLLTMVPSIAIWKHHVKDGKRLSPKEIFALQAGQFTGAHDFEAAGIKFEDNTPEEINDAVMEMADNVERGWPNRSKAEKDFWNSFPRALSPFNGKPLHGEIRMRIGTKFLEQYT